MAISLDDLLADVQEMTDLNDSLLQFLTNLEAQLAEAHTDPVKLQNIRTMVRTQSDKIRAALVANTPVDTPAPEGTTDVTSEPSGPAPAGDGATAAGLSSGSPFPNS